MNRVLKKFGQLKIYSLFLAVLMLGNLFMLTWAGSVTRTVGAMIVLLLPGVVWAEALDVTPDRLLRWTIGAGLSYAFMIVSGLFFTYLPGPLFLWQVLWLNNVVVLAAIVFAALIWKGQSRVESSDNNRLVMLVLVFILVCGAFFRFVNLGVSEFDGDEVKALFPAAETIAGDRDAIFFQRKKGPGEIFVPMLIWQLTGLVNEGNVRVPFAIAGTVTILVAYFLGQRLFNDKIGLLAAGFIALNGLIVAFSRIVQYQQIVILMSLLALLCIWLWRRDNWGGWWGLTGLFIGVGILSHYDTVLVTPALIYAGLAQNRLTLKIVKNLIMAGSIILVITAVFFVPYLFEPQVVNTGQYLGERIGGEFLKNQLANFFHIHSFYSSFYYIAILYVLAFSFLVYALVHLNWVKKLPAGSYVISAMAAISVAVASIRPELASIMGLDFGVFIFTVLFLGAFLSPAAALEHRTIIVWLAVTFLGYNFLVASPRTHSYTILLPLVYLASISAGWILSRIAVGKYRNVIPVIIGAFLLFLFGGYLYNAYLSPTVQFEIDWQESNPRLYWSPYSTKPDFDAYGFIHQVGWKAVGGLYLMGQLKGDYQTNGLLEKADWYTRHQVQGCYRQAANFFDVSYRVLNPAELAQYRYASLVSLPNGKSITIYQKDLSVPSIESIDETALSDLFDQTAYPAAFVRPLSLIAEINANFAGHVVLSGYELTAPEVQPGQPLNVTLNWQVMNAVPLDADVFVHLEDSQSVGKVWGQSNGAPACGNRPTSSWHAGEMISDRHTLLINPDTPPGEYVLVAGLYLAGDNRRVPVLDANGTPIADAIKLSTMIIK